ncbi:MAG TPA: hypothetical protein PKD83_04495 [Ignavibacteria bacterium]|nr:hypothetical protein [Ignavibacteria bacterium]
MATDTKNHTKEMIDLIKKAQKEEILFQEIFNNPDQKTGKNEFLFFIKPEITLDSDKINTAKILDLIQEKIAISGFNIQNIKILSAKYLDKYDIIAQHYGVINKIASGAVKNLSEGAKGKFKELFGKDVDEVKVSGGIEFLNEYKDFNAYSLDYLWQNKENLKLAGGTYCEEIKIDNERIYLINGFHPRQLRHFTEKGRSIIVFTLSSDMSWTDARNNFIGATNPSAANEGSLRREFLKNITELGLSEVSQGSNGVHLSAGPVEALIELKRYNSNFSVDTKTVDFKEFSFGKKLYDTFSENSVKEILENVNVETDGKSVSVFDLTEEKNADEAIEILKKFFK